MTSVVSQRLQDRYCPPLPWVGADGQAWSHTAVKVVCSLLTYDWTITDAERRALIAALYSHEWVFTLEQSRQLAIAAVRDLAGWGRVDYRAEVKAENFVAVYASATMGGSGKYRPCASCDKVTRHCGQCGECAGCATEGRGAARLAECGCCLDCYRECSRCEGCTACGACDCAMCGHCDEPCESTCSACERCQSCCTCSQCRECGPVDSTCSRCEYCPECCDCCHCDDCGDACESTCNHDDDDDDDDGEPAACIGGFCESCCRISDRTRRRGTGRAGDYEVQPDRRMHTATSPRDRRQFRCTRLAGVEVEYNRCSKFAPIESWAQKYGAATHRDGSCGWEAVTSPAAGDHLLRQLGDLATALHDSGASIDTRCGVHVHADGRDLRWPDVARLARLWARIEPLMFVLAGQARVENQYCEPWKDEITSRLANTDDARAAILDACYSPEHGMPGKEWLKCKGKACENLDRKNGYGGYRYRALNLAPWITRMRLGGAARYDVRGQRYVPSQRKLASDATIEFRLHEATLDAAELQQWAMLCVRIVECAATWTDREVARLPRSAARALARIAPDCQAWIVRKLKAWRATTERAPLSRALDQARRIGYHPRTGYTIGPSPTWAVDRVNDAQPSLPFGNLPSLPTYNWNIPSPSTRCLQDAIVRMRNMGGR